MLRAALPLLPLQEQTIRSTSLQFDVAAGPVSTAELTAAGADQETLTISNGKEASQRWAKVDQLIMCENKGSYSGYPIFCRGTLHIP